MKTRICAIATLILIAITLAAIGATTFSGNLMVRPAWTHQSTGITTVSESIGRFLDWDHTSGTSTNQMDLLFRERVALTNGQARTIDLAGGVTNAFGEAITFAEVRVMCVLLSATNLNTITVGNAAANEFATWCGGTNHTVTVRPGGIVLLVGPDATGYAVSTNGNLKVTNDGTNNISYDIYIGGSSQ